MYLQNAWYVAAWPGEVTSTPLARTLLDEPIVFYRGEDGRVVALEDRCCHRGTPLSQGELVGNNIKCMYHGMVFDGTGRCVEIPGQDIIPARAKVRRYPTEERDGIVWIWMGDPALADSDQIIPYPFHSTWPYRSKTDHLRCNYTMISDNLLDQTHLAYVHQKTLSSTSTAHTHAEMNTEGTPDGVRFVRWMRNCPPPPVYAKAVQFKGRVDRWQEFQYHAPSCIIQYTGALDVGMGAYEEGRRDGGFGLRIFHGMTPETENTSWYFWSASNGHQQDIPEATEILFAEVQNAFQEDYGVLEAQWGRLCQLGDRPLINIASDGARMQARHALERKIAAERGIAREAVVTAA